MDMKPMNSIVISWQPPEGADVIGEANNLAEFFKEQRTKIQALLTMDASSHCEKVGEQHPMIGVVAKYGKYRGNRALVEIKFCNECMPLSDTIEALRGVITSKFQAKDLPDLKYELNDVDVEDLIAGRLSLDRIGLA